VKVEDGVRNEVRMVKRGKRKDDTKGNPLPDSVHSFFFSLRYQFASSPAY
jgi:hypothetical protein